MNKILLLLVLFTLAASVPIDVPYPERNPDCIDDYFLIFYFEEHQYCSETVPNGNYFLFGCTMPWKDGHKLYTEDFCQYTSSIIREVHTINLPIITR